MSETDRHYQAPGWFTRNVANRIMFGLTRAGLSVRGSRILTVRGRRSGLPRTVPVNPLTLGDARYLVAPRGETEWVRNLRAAGEGELRLGRRTEHFAARELPDADKPAVLRAYLKNWKAEVGIFFDGVSDTSSEAEIAGIAPRHPVFVISAA
jgi:deazaflavin-dependent oxidoreductase (nitroreductase family)